MQGGYKAFWRAHGELCDGDYTPMDHPAFSAQLKACHAVVRKAWSRTTRTFGAQQRKRRPSYCLRQSTGGRSSSRGTSAVAEEAAAAAEAEQAGAPPPAFAAARHAMRAF